MSNTLLNACYAGDLEAVQREIEVNSADPNFSAPSNVITQHQRDEKALINKFLKKADINPLAAVLVGNQNPAVIKYLLEHGADANSLTVKYVAFEKRYLNGIDIINKSLFEHHGNKRNLAECLIYLFKYKINKEHDSRHFGGGPSLKRITHPDHKTDNEVIAAVIVASLVLGDHQLFAKVKDRLIGVTTQHIETYSAILGVRGYLPFVKRHLDELTNECTITRDLASTLLASFTKAEQAIPNNYEDLPVQIRRFMKLRQRQKLTSLIAKLAYHANKRVTSQSTEELSISPFMKSRQLLEDCDVKTVLVYTESHGFLKSFLQDDDLYLVAMMQFNPDIENILAEIAAEPSLKDTSVFARIVFLFLKVNSTTETEMTVIQAGKAQIACTAMLTTNVVEELRELKTKNDKLHSELSEAKAAISELQATLESMATVNVKMMGMLENTTKYKSDPTAHESASSPTQKSGLFQ